MLSSADVILTQIFTWILPSGGAIWTQIFVSVLNIWRCCRKELAVFVWFPLLPPKCTILWRVTQQSRITNNAHTVGSITYSFKSNRSINVGMFTSISPSVFSLRCSQHRNATQPTLSTHISPIQLKCCVRFGIMSTINKQWLAFETAVTTWDGYYSRVKDHINCALLRQPSGPTNQSELRHTLGGLRTPEQQKHTDS